MLELSLHFPADVICTFRTTIGVSEQAGVASGKDSRSKVAGQLPIFGHHRALAGIRMTYARSSVGPSPCEVQERARVKNKGCTERAVMDPAARAQCPADNRNSGTRLSLRCGKPESRASTYAKRRAVHAPEQRLPWDRQPFSWLA